MFQKSVGGYQVLGGSTYEVLMPNLRNSGLVLMSVADVMRARLECTDLGDDDELSSLLLDGYINTADGVSSHKRKIVLAYSPQVLMDIDKHSKLVNGAVAQSPNQLKGLEGPHLSRKDLERAGLGVRLSIQNAKSHPFWLGAARDKHLLWEYADFIYAKMMQRYKEDKAMGVYLDPRQKNLTIRQCVIGGIGKDKRTGGTSDIYAGGRSDIYVFGGIARLVCQRSKSTGDSHENNPLDAIVEKTLVMETI